MLPSDSLRRQPKFGPRSFFETRQREHPTRFPQDKLPLRRARRNPRFVFQIFLSRYRWPRHRCIPKGSAQMSFPPLPLHRPAYPRKTIRLRNTGYTHNTYRSPRRCRPDARYGNGFPLWNSPIPANTVQRCSADTCFSETAFARADDPISRSTRPETPSLQNDPPHSPERKTAMY